MGDLFDEFMRELERRRAQAEGRTPPDEPAADDEDGEDAEDDDDGDPEEAERRARARHAADEAEDAREPTPIRRKPAGKSDGTPPAGGGRGPGGPDDGASSIGFGGVMRRLGIGLVIVVVTLVIFLASAGISLWTDAIWYQSVGYDSVFWTRLGAQVGLFLVALLISLVVLLGNLWLAGRFAPPPDPDKPGGVRKMAERISEAQRQAERAARMGGAGGRGPAGPFGRPENVTPGFDLEDLPDVVPIARWVIALVAVFIAVGIAGSVSGAWTTILLWANKVPFDSTTAVTDPVFGRDIGFFLFELPFLRWAQSLFSGLMLASLLVAGARYLAAATEGGEVFVTRVRVHLAVLAGLYLVSVAFGYQLDKYELVYATSGAIGVVGVGYADANARFLAYDVLTFLSGIAGALLIAGAFTRWLWPLGAIVVIWFSAGLVLGRLYPEAIQRLTVDPNEYAQEEPYIANNIAMTRLAFGLDQWDTFSYAGTAPLTRAAVENEADTFTNARLWDYRPLGTTLDQFQVIRQYYDFVDVDTDRYVVDDTLRQVMLTGRELAIERNPQASSWVNQRVIYTHGIGLAMVPVNEVTQEGQPELWVRDLPPISTPGTPEVVQPRIYFGERDDHYVVTGARQPEFDIPGDGVEPDSTYNWTAKTGIALDSTLTKLLFSLRFRDFDLLISDQVTNQSQLLFRRTIDERTGAIAPFLRYDKDPYLVVDDAGNLIYIQDAYTISDAFPNATWFNSTELAPESGLYGESFNYLRNSVKITMNAYDGTMTFYVADDADPLVRAWQGVFPDLFRPLSELPVDLQDNLRVPEEQFNVQSRTYGQYHVTQPLTWFNNNDRWTVPSPLNNTQSLPPEAYYVVMRMPGEPKAEFLLLQPMIAQNRPNMIAWVAARNDPGTYGQVRAYRFPSETTIFGPAQIEGRIDQDPIISSQITLWSQAGSSVIRGNLIVVPVGESLLYLQPVYLQSTSAAFPEFQKIIVASPTTIVWADSLREALEALLDRQGQGPSASPTPGPTGTPGPTATPRPSATPAPGGELPSDVDGLIDYANAHFEAAQAALRDGDLATYGAEMDLVGAALARLAELTGSPTP